MTDEALGFVERKRRDVKLDNLVDELIKEAQQDQDDPEGEDIMKGNNNNTTKEERIESFEAQRLIIQIRTNKELAKALESYQERIKGMEWNEVPSEWIGELQEEQDRITGDHKDQIADLRIEFADIFEGLDDDAKAIARTKRFNEERKQLQKDTHERIHKIYKDQQIELDMLIAKWNPIRRSDNLHGLTSDGKFKCVRCWIESRDGNKFESADPRIESDPKVSGYICKECVFDLEWNGMTVLEWIEEKEDDGIEWNKIDVSDERTARINDLRMKYRKEVQEAIAGGKDEWKRDDVPDPILDPVWKDNRISLQALFDQERRELVEDYPELDGSEKWNAIRERIMEDLADHVNRIVDRAKWGHIDRVNRDHFE